MFNISISLCIINIFSLFFFGKKPIKLEKNYYLKHVIKLYETKVTGSLSGLRHLVTSETENTLNMLKNAF